jgi:hypothetical protein
VAHIFLTRVRDYYDIDGLWAEAERTIIEDKPRAAGKVAKTKKAVAKRAVKSKKPAAARSPRKRAAK